MLSRFWHLPNGLFRDECQHREPFRQTRRNSVSPVLFCDLYSMFHSYYRNVICSFWYFLLFECVCLCMCVIYVCMCVYVWGWVGHVFMCVRMWVFILLYLMFSGVAGMKEESFPPIFRFLWLLSPLPHTHLLWLHSLSFASVAISFCLTFYAT